MRRVSRQIIAATLFLAFGAEAQDMEITMSRHGYNLLWPTKRCCAFDLRLLGDGSGTLAVKRNADADPVIESHPVKLSAKDMRALQRAVEEIDFFSLPKEICCGPVDGDMQRISVSLAGRNHQVSFGEGAFEKQRGEFDRVMKLWRELKRLFKIEGENVEAAANAS
jgi:hypothetical protein